MSLPGPYEVLGLTICIFHGHGAEVSDEDQTRQKTNAAKTQHGKNPTWQKPNTVKTQCGKNPTWQKLNKVS
jgi:hypothetical protein